MAEDTTDGELTLVLVSRLLDQIYSIYSSLCVCAFAAKGLPNSRQRVREPQPVCRHLYLRPPPPFANGRITSHLHMDT